MTLEEIYTARCKYKSEHTWNGNEPVIYLGHKDISDVVAEICKSPQAFIVPPDGIKEIFGMRIFVVDVHRHMNITSSPND